LTSTTKKTNLKPASAGSKEQTVEQTVQECIHRTEDREPQVRAFVDFDPEGALAQARALDALAPTQRGPLHGMPVAIKEVFDVKGLKCTWGTPIHADRVPETDAWVVATLREAGAVIMGTTVSTEYALATTGPTRNPWDSSRTPGASSSGSAAAVGAGMVPVALGSQTIGSIIRPAAYCGIFGFKPSWGLIDDTGAMPLSEALDHVGILAADIRDLRNIFSILRSSLATNTVRECHENRLVKIHVMKDIGEEVLSPTALAIIDRAADVFKSQDCELAQAALTSEFADSENILRIILCRDMARHHGSDRDQAGDQMSERVRSMIDKGCRVVDDEYHQALERVTVLAAYIDKMIGPEGVILTASTIDVAPAFTQGTGSRAPQLLWSLVGMPAITVPCGLANGLPIGVQLVGARGNDNLVLSTAERLSKNLPY